MNKKHSKCHENKLKVMKNVFLSNWFEPQPFPLFNKSAQKTENTKSKI